MAKPQSPVVVLGAGATKACGGPLTDEFLADAFSEPLYSRMSEIRHPLDGRSKILTPLGGFLKDFFHLPGRPSSRIGKERYPALPLLLSLIDTALDREQPFDSSWSVDKVAKVRVSVEYAIFAVLKNKLGSSVPDWHRKLLRYFGRSAPKVISMNYDLIVDNAVAGMGRSDKGGASIASYSVDIVNRHYAAARKHGLLLKLHGSLNWLYCPNCHRLDVRLKSRMHSKTQPNYFFRPLHTFYHNRDSCDRCKTGLQPIIITPTHAKDYRNPHISRVWYEADRMLREADRVIFVGYSLPQDDFEVVYLLKRALSGLDGQNITVVESDKENRAIDEHDVGCRYRSLFGENVEWVTEGFENWLGTCRRKRINPLEQRLDGKRLRKRRS